MVTKNPINKNMISEIKMANESYSLVKWLKINLDSTLSINKMYSL